MGASEATAHGIESWPQSKSGWNGIIDGLRQENALPAGWTSGTGWGQIYRDYTNASDSNTRIAIKDFYVYLFNKNTKTWQQVQGPTFNGASYVENYATNNSVSANSRTEADGSISVKLTKGYNFHFYPGGRWNITTALGGAGQAGYYAVFKARKIMDNPSGVDDRSTARYLMNVGGDWWQTPSVGYGGFAVTNREIGFSKFKYISNDWQTIRQSTVLDADLTNFPPPQ